MNATKRNNLQQVIKSKLETLGFTIDVYSPNDRADLIGYDINGKYFAVKLSDDRNTYFEGKNGIRLIMCNSFDQFISLLTNKKPLTQVKNESLWP